MVYDATYKKVMTGGWFVKLGLPHVHTVLLVIPSHCIVFPSLVGIVLVFFGQPSPRNVLALVGLLQFRDAWPPAGLDRDKAAAARYLQQQARG